MFKKKSLTIVMVASLLSGNVAYASFSDALVGGVVGGVVGSVITNEVYHKKRHRKRRHRAKKRHVVKKRYVAPKPRPIIETSEMKIQKTLTALGFYRGKIDGEVNSYETRAAIKEMNTAYELGNTASLAPRTRDTLIYLADLFSFDRVLISKDNGEKAKGRKIQAALKIHGFYHDKIDGAIGSGTRMNIAEYKRAKGLSSGTSFDFEEEYQLVNSAKSINDKNMDDAMALLKGIPAQNQPKYVNRQMPSNSGVMLQRKSMPEQQNVVIQPSTPIQQNIVANNMPAKQNVVQQTVVPVTPVTNNVIGK